jgi:hypothetical protein
MEFCEKGDLGKKIKNCIKNKELLAEKIIWKYVW